MSRRNSSSLNSLTSSARALSSLAPGSAPTNEEAGILGPVAGITGSLQAAEAVEMLLGPETLSQRIVHFDTRSGLFENIEVGKKPDCPACVGRRFEHLDGRDRGHDAR